MEPKAIAVEPGRTTDPHAERVRLAALDHAFLWHPFTQMADWLQEEPLIIDRAEGVYLYDLEGRAYLDGTASIWLNVHGHRRPEIDAAIRLQLEKVAHSTLLGLANVPAIELAARLVEWAPPGLSKVFYSDNGSTAVEIALKMAFQYWHHRGESRRLFISMENAYHGDTLGAVSVGAIPTFHGVFQPLLFDVIRTPYPYPYRHPSGDPERCSQDCLQQLKAALKQHGSHVAAVIVEPLLQAAGGMIVMPPGFLRAVADLCKEANVLLIADEVATGFGRTGHMFACLAEGVTPDLMAIGKGLTGGYLPLAATLTTHAVFDAFLGPYEAKKTFFHGHSYTGNPLACAAALANLDIFARENTITRVRERATELAALLTPLAEQKHVGEIRQIGLVAGIELVLDRQTREPFAWEQRIGVRVTRRARELGLILRPLGHVLVLMPALTVTREEMAQMVAILSQAIADVTEADR